MLDETGADGVLHHTVPAHWLLRGFLVACGAFIAIILVTELGRALWPINYFTPFFALIFFGGLSVGGAMIAAGLFGPAYYWTIGPGSLDIQAQNPFRTVSYRYGPTDISGFTLVKHVDSDGPDTWSVEITTSSGKRFQSRHFGSEDYAESVRKRFEAAFYA